MNNGRIREIQVCHHVSDNSYTVVASRGYALAHQRRYTRPTQSSLQRLARLSYNNNIEVRVTLLAGGGSPAVFYERRAYLQEAGS